MIPTICFRYSIYSLRSSLSNSKTFSSRSSLWFIARLTASKFSVCLSIRTTSRLRHFPYRSKRFFSASRRFSAFDSIQDVKSSFKNVPSCCRHLYFLAEPPSPLISQPPWLRLSAISLILSPAANSRFLFQSDRPFRHAASLPSHPFRESNRPGAPPSPHVFRLFRWLGLFA